MPCRHVQRKEGSCLKIKGHTTIYVVLILRRVETGLCRLTIGLVCTQSKHAPLPHIHSNAPTPRYPLTQLPSAETQTEPDRR